ncbi:MAG: hypothetical protein E6R05_00910 [Candidatus Moraniibacteriota bacterium]|nr:MAG: hypothetical protein E6R05_00910 [Candidatus Moranbacteria bacterium]
MEIIKSLLSNIRRHILIYILVLATLLRVVNLATNPPGLNWDEVSMGYTAYSLQATGRDEWGEPWPILFRSYGEWKSPVYIYLLIPFINLLGLNAWGVRLPAALFGVLTVYLTYALASRIYSRRVGLFAALLLAVSPWHLMLSRPAFEAGVALALMLAGINLLLIYFEKKTTPSIFYILLSSLLFGLSLHTYHSAKIVVPLIILFLGWIYRKRLSIKLLIYPMLVLLFFAYPIAKDVLTGKTQARYNQVGITTDAELVERFYRYRQTAPFGSVGNKIVFNKYTFILTKGFSNWTSYLSPHFLLGSSSIRAQHSIPFRGVLYFVEFALFIYGLFLLRRSTHPLRYLPIFVILVAFIPPALTKDTYHVLRSILTLPWWQVVSAFGLNEMMKYNKYQKLSTFTLLLLTCEVLIFIFIYFAWYPKAFARDWQYGYKEIAQWVAQKESSYESVVITKEYGEPHLFFAFYNKWDPTWYQNENKKLIEYEKRGYPWLDQLPEYSLGKYTFRPINWALDNVKSNSVFVGKGDDFWSDTSHPLSIYFPDGTPAFRVSEGK